MKAVSGKDLARALERNGWSLLRVQGCHRIYGKVGREARISIPIHSGAGLKKACFRWPACGRKTCSAAWTPFSIESTQ
ncbi:MAG TPA: type II toxin-antitoxin system HicA family toxin [Candidatus Bathyarchaeia archaeon]|nr:type II toxin-antitoxin system HicA family toxin [Candidatus Bathyarchaeia archaeon]